MTFAVSPHFSSSQTSPKGLTMAISNSNPPDLSQKLPTLVPRQRKPSSTVASLEPVPETPNLPPPPKTVSEFQVPTRRILSPHDLDKFHASPTYSLILAFIFGVSDSVQQKKVSDVSLESASPIVKQILSILDEVKNVAKETPPIDTESRFGNPAYRTFVDKLKSHLEGWHMTLNVPSAAIPELATYLEHSFGSASRIDYGSGHELNLFLWLLCLNRLALLPRETFPAIGLIIFPHYLALMRSIQMSYYLEPAGSHGVWGLDDYQFLPFLFGAAQLVHHKYITPKSIHNEATVEECAKDYLYFDQVDFVNGTKTVKGLRWHSPMLDDISGARNWEKVEAGMKKMFVKDVLGKLPVMQHFLFGSLIRAAEGMSEEAQAEQIDHDDHDHKAEPSTWGDCCGIKVPSHLGAAGEMKKRMGGDGLRRIPFD
jgi:serine/threonine-protein phosphatase 2A activator